MFLTFLFFWQSSIVICTRVRRESSYIDLNPKYLFEANPNSTHFNLVYEICYIIIYLISFLYLMFKINIQIYSCCFFFNLNNIVGFLLSELSKPKLQPTWIRINYSQPNLQRKYLLPTRDQVKAGSPIIIFILNLIVVNIAYFDASKRMTY